MPKKGRKSGGKNGDSCLFPFHHCINAALSGGVISALLSPNSGVSPRGLIEADTWAHFRVRNFKFRIHPSVAASANPVAVGYVGGIQDITPATFASVMELLPSVVLGGDASTPSDWVHVSKTDLAGPLPWYKTLPGTPDPTEEAPGVLCIAGTGTEQVVVELRGTFEFKTAVATANSPLALAARKQLREERIRAMLTTERDLIIKILGTTTPTSVPK